MAFLRTQKNLKYCRSQQSDVSQRCVRCSLSSRWLLSALHFDGSQLDHCKARWQDVYNSIVGVLPETRKLDVRTNLYSEVSTLVSQHALERVRHVHFQFCVAKSKTNDSVKTFKIKMLRPLEALTKTKMSSIEQTIKHRLNKYFVAVSLQRALKTILIENTYYKDLKHNWRHEFFPKYSRW